MLGWLNREELASVTWEEDKFSTRQNMLYIEYAVSDALLASHIFLRLVKIKFNPLSQGLDIFCLWETKTENSLTPCDACVECKTVN